jgi:hypothetical protein
MAGRPFPTAATYEGFTMHEDGVGMARTFEREFLGETAAPTGTRSGFFAAVDLPANPAAYTGLRATMCGSGGDGGGVGGATTVALGPARRAPIGVLSGELGARVVGPLIDRLGRDDVRVIPVRNEFFGGNTAVTGLMTGADLSRVLADEPERHRYLLPDVCLSDEHRFLDGLTVADLPRPVEVVATDGLALRAALGDGTGARR